LFPIGFLLTQTRQLGRDKTSVKFQVSTMRSKGDFQRLAFELHGIELTRTEKDDKMNSPDKKAYSPHKKQSPQKVGVGDDSIAGQFSDVSRGTHSRRHAAIIALVRKNFIQTIIINKHINRRSCITPTKLASSKRPTRPRSSITPPPGTSERSWTATRMTATLCSTGHPPSPILPQPKSPDMPQPPPSSPRPPSTARSTTRTTTAPRRSNPTMSIVRRKSPRNSLSSRTCAYRILVSV